MSYVQVPPDGAGKKIFTKTHTIGANQVEAQIQHIADPTNPEYLQKIDVLGQAYTRFVEGSPLFDAFGNMKVSQATLLGSYKYSESPMSGVFQDVVQSTGSIAWNPQDSTTVISVGTQAQASATRTTNRRHIYQPGISNIITLTLTLGDSGKSGNTRRWGYFSVNDGLYWELNGTSLNVTQRSSTSGSVQNTVVPRSQWNGDKLDGTGPSGVVIDLTKANYYWIEFAWLGVGVSRFGVLAPDGTRWECHTFRNPNNNTGPYMATGSLPLRLENFNTVATAGTSELRHICSSVYASSKTEGSSKHYSDVESANINVGASSTHVLTMRPGLLSTKGIAPEYINAFITGGPVKLSVIDNAQLVAPTWVSTTSLSEVTYSGTVTSGTSVFSTYLPVGTSVIDLAPIYKYFDSGYFALADGSDSSRFSIVVSKLDPISTVSVVLGVGYKELM